MDEQDERKVCPFLQELCIENECKLYIEFGKPNCAIIKLGLVINEQTDNILSAISFI